MQEGRVNEKLLQVLKTVAPGTRLREGLENILRAKTGALIVKGKQEQVLQIAEGGFVINADLTPANLYELAKMDGAIIISDDARKILAANTQLIPDLSIPSRETGIRHRTAERVAKQTGALVISISQRRSVITIYQGALKYLLRDLNVILANANQAVQTLEKYRHAFDRVMASLGVLEFDSTVTLLDVTKAIQRVEMLGRIEKEIERYTCELGIEGRLITTQVDELVTNVREEGLLVIRDYATQVGEKPSESIMQVINSWSSEDLLDLTLIARALGYPGSTSILDQNVYPRGYRMLSRIPRLPQPVIENLVQTFGILRRILKATIEELDDVEGIGEARARTIKTGLERYRDQLLQEGHM